jgi:hypothetical protein
VDINNASAMAQTQVIQTTEAAKHNKKAASLSTIKKRRTRRRSGQTFMTSWSSSKP